MSDLIDRQALLRQIDIDSDGEPGYYGDTWKFIDTIKRMPSALGTNLAEVGTDLISRKQAIDALENDKAALSQIISGMSANDAQLDHFVAQHSQVIYDIDAITQLPTIQPEIVRCKDCKYAEYIDDVKTLWCTECGQGRTVAPYDFCSYAERREVKT